MDSEMADAPWHPFSKSYAMAWACLFTDQEQDAISPIGLGADVWMRPVRIFPVSAKTPSRFCEDHCIKGDLGCPVLNLNQFVG